MRAGSSVRPSGWLMPPLILAAFGSCALALFGGSALFRRLLPTAPKTAAELASAEALFMLIVFGSLLLFALIGGALAGINPLRIGRRPGLSLLLGLTLGVAGLLAAAGYAAIAGAVAPAAGRPVSAGLFLAGSLLVLFQVGAEEAFFRGWLQRLLVASWGVWPGVLVASTAFAGLHVLGGTRGPLTLLNLFLAGLLFGLLAVRTGGVVAPTAAHFGWNWSEQLVLGLFPNPGTGSFGALIDLDLSGAAIWGGSEEGLNASAALTLALLVLIVPLLLLRRSRVRTRRRFPAAAAGRSTPSAS